MNDIARQAFQEGSGVDPLHMKVVLVLIAAGLMFTAGAWIVMQLMDAYRNDDITSRDVVLGVVKLAILMGLVLIAITIV